MQALLSKLNGDTPLHVRTVAAIMVWFVVVLLFLNRFLRSEWITPLAIALTAVALVVYFSPRLRKGTKQDKHETEPVTASDQ